MSGKALVLRNTRTGVQLDEMLPDPGLLITAAGIVIIAVVLWGAVSLVRGQLIQPLEAVMFAFVFAFVYFGSLSLLGDSESSGESS